MSATFWLCYLTETILLICQHPWDSIATLRPQERPVRRPERHYYLTSPAIQRSTRPYGFYETPPSLEEKRKELKKKRRKKKEGKEERRKERKKERRKGGKRKEGKEERRKRGKKEKRKEGKR